MRTKKISAAVVRRLPIYLRVLEEATRDGDKELMSSQELGEKAGVSPALVRKDLAWFGQFADQDAVYECSPHRTVFRLTLHLDRDVSSALVCAGSLGEVLVRYCRRRDSRDPGLHLNIVAVFDADPEKQVQ